MLEIDIDSGPTQKSYARGQKKWFSPDIVRHAPGSLTGYRVLINSATESFVR